MMLPPAPSFALSSDGSTHTKQNCTLTTTLWLFQKPLDAFQNPTGVLTTWLSAVTPAFHRARSEESISDDDVSTEPPDYLFNDDCFSDPPTPDPND
jgi:hypothetical protein